MYPKKFHVSLMMT